MELTLQTDKKVLVIDINTVIRMNLKPDQNLCKYCLDCAQKNSVSNEEMSVNRITEDLDTSY